MKQMTLEQIARLNEALKEARITKASMARDLEASRPAIQYSLNQGRLQTGFGLQICMVYGINPFYVQEGIEPKFVNWEEAFQMPLKKYSSAGMSTEVA